MHLLFCTSFKRGVPSIFAHPYETFYSLTIHVLWLVQTYINHYYLRKLYKGLPKKRFIMTINKENVNKSCVFVLA